MPKMKLNCRDRSNGVQSTMKTTQDNDLTSHREVVYAENYKELWGPIKPGVIYTKIRQNNYMTNLTGAVYAEKEIELS